MLKNSMYECYEIVKACRSKGIELSVDNARIKISGARGGLDDQLLARIKEQRDELILFLTNEEALAARHHGGLRTLTASDFPWSNMSAELLSSPQVQNAGTENLYIAAPMQAGLLFHGLLDESGASYTSITACDLKGPLNISAFRQAWQHVVRRHEIFRTCFVGLQEKQIHQLVRREVELPLRELDWSALPEADRTASLEQLRRADKALGFDFGEAPLLRLTLVRLGDQHYHFIWSHHHILMDGWCLPVVFREVLVSYRAFADGVAQPALPRPAAYASYIAWLYRQDTGKARAFWQQYLAGFSAPTPLMIGNSPMLRPEGEPRSLTLEVGAELSSGLRAVAKATQTTISTVVQAAWSILLQRYSGESEVVFGATVSGRPAGLPGIEQMIGLFINTLPVRVRFAADLTFNVLLQQIHQANVFAEEHSFLGLVDIQQVSEVPNGIALFDSVLVFENYPTAIDTGAQAAVDISIESVHSEDHTNYALTVIARHQDQLSIDVDYWSGSISEANVHVLIGHLRQILTWMVEGDSGRAVLDIELLTHEERCQLRAWNATRAPFPEERCIHELFEAQVAAAAQHVAAISFDGQQLSYSQLNARANQLAHHLVARGVRPDTLVGLCMERSLEMLIGILGILKAGGAYVPLDPEYPQARLAFMLADSAVPIIVAQQALLGVLPPGDRELICLDAGESQAMLQRMPQSDLPVGQRELTSRHLAYAMYTSGSTGKPKGVLIEHQALVNRLDWMQKQYPLEATDKVLQKTPFSFDVSVWELLWPITVGAQLVFAKPGGHKEPSYLHEVITQYGITTLHYVPSMLRVMLEATKLADCRSLRRVLCSGEALPHDLVAAYFQSVGTGCELHNLYGPTEAAIDVSHWDCRRYRAASCIPIGRPIQNISLHVLDQHLRPQPVGIPGELHIGGVGLARGYLNQAALTESKFVSAVGGAELSGRMYKTGDLARWLPDGNLEFLRRIDDQVKIRGFRIELGEIEQQLSELEDVKDSAVLCLEGHGREQRLVAYVTPMQALQPDAAEGVAERKRQIAARCLEGLRTRLPEYMVPAVLVVIEALPMSSNGKLDKRALPAPDEADLQKQVYLAPRNETEARLCAIWQQVLELERVGVQDSFFALGGHSLLAVRLVTRIREQFNQSLPLKQLFLTPTVAGVAAYLHEQRGEAVDLLPTIEVDEVNQHQPFALTGVQQAYLLGRSDVFALGNVAAHGYHEFNVPTVELARLEDAWNRFVQRHGMLRAVFSEEGTQRILPDVPRYRIAYVDLRGETEAVRQVQLQQIRAELSHQVFAVDRWPLFELRVTRIAEAHYRLHYSMDLLLVDGSSARILAREMLRLYADPACELAPLSLSFRDYVLAEQAIRDTPLYEKSREYWLQRLESLPIAPALPLARDPGEIREPKFERRQFKVEAAQWRALKVRINELGVTPTVLLLTVFSQVLSRWSKSLRFTLNLTLFNRLPMHEQVDLLVGDFTSLTLLEIEASSQRTLGENAKSIQAQLWDDLEYRHFGGVEVLRALNRRSGSHQAVSMPVVFTSALVLDRDEPEKHGKVLDSPAALNAQDYGITQTSQIWLDHVVREDKGALHLHWDAIEELFPAGMLDEMFASYRQLLEGMVSGRVGWQECYRPGLPAEQQRRREAVNATHVEREWCGLHELFVRQVRARSQAEAVLAVQRQLSYAEVDRLAGGLSQRLHELGAARNELIAVVMEKGWEQVVAVLGVLYSGAAYLPIDAGLPPARIEQLLRLGQVRIALTQPWLQGQLSWPAGVEVVAAGEQPQPGYYLGSVEPTDLAYVIFTSGSTGEPKGVMIDHRGAVNTILDINAKFGVGPQDRVLALSSLSFDLSVYDVFGLLGSGGAIVLPQSQLEKDPAHWVERVKSCGVTLWNTVPALAQLYVEQLKGEACGSVRVFLLSGDWIPLTLPAQLQHSSAGTQVVSLGGATEASIWSIYHRVEQVQEHWKSVPYGTPLENQSFRVLKPDYSECPEWVSGELYIGGIGLAQGYWRDEVKTRSSFIVHPHSGERLYKTGDLGRYLSDGSIEFLGREDLQVKVHGHRIELGEIEAALSRHELISDAIVLAVGESRHHKSLVAYVQPARGAAVELSEEPGLVGAGAELLQGQERLRFKLEQRGLRSIERPAAALLLPCRADERSELLLAGGAGSMSYALQPGEIGLERLGGWLSCLCQVEMAEHPLPKRYYPSAGSLYPVQTYLQVPQGAVSGVAAGCYYYDPSGHRLVLLTADVPRGAAAGGLSLYLVTDLRAVQPLYGDQGLRFSQLEAGHMQQLLLSTAASHGIGLARARLELSPRLRGGFELSDQHVLMSGLVCGRAEPSLAVCKGVSCVSRQSYRSYLPGAVARAVLESLLGELLGSEPDLQIYVHGKANRVTGLAAGVYRYEPMQQQLQAVSVEQAGGLGSNRGRGVNAGVYAAAAFSLYLVGPRGQEVSAGEVGQRLMNAAPGLGLGLCPIGSEACGELGAGRQLLYSFQGGGISEEQARHWPLEPTLGKTDVQAQLREYLSARLPAYMVPNVYVVLERFPLTGNGKVDRRALPLPQHSEPAQTAYLAPRNETEARLCAIWQQVLGLERVGVQDNFFELGGNSLLAIKVMNLIRAAFECAGTELSLTYLFRHPTPAQLGEVLALQGALQELERSKRATSGLAEEEIEFGEV